MTISLPSDNEGKSAMQECVSATRDPYEVTRVWRQQQLRLSEPRLQFFQLKYIVERCLGVGLLVFVSPLVLVLCGLVKLTSKGPGFYRQERVGLDRKVFHVVKLRTMIVGAQPEGTEIRACKNDLRITGFGKFLRKTHLDELPQLFNVAAGDMVLIGPRPEQPGICEGVLAPAIEGYYDRVKVKPGITGLSQINLEPDSAIEDAMQKQVLDLHYINSTNGWLEFRILLATALRVFGISGATVMNWMGLRRQGLLDSLEQPVEEQKIDVAQGKKRSPRKSSYSESSITPLLFRDRKTD